MKVGIPKEISVLKSISSAIVRERDVHKLLNDVIDILDREMGMLRGTITLLEGDELRIEASARMLNAEERALGRYRIGEGITGMVAKTGQANVVLDIRKDKRFLNRTRSRKAGRSPSRTPSAPRSTPRPGAPASSPSAASRSETGISR